MGKYKRLSYRGKEDEIEYKDMIELPFIIKLSKKYACIVKRDNNGNIMKTFSMPIDEAERKLCELKNGKYRQELENKIERGTLIELPCSIYDLLWYIAGEKGEEFVDAINLFGIRISEIDTIGEKYFLTKEAAESRLKEIKEQT